MKPSGKSADRKLSRHYSSRISNVERLLKQLELFTQNIDLLKSLLKK